MLGAEKKRKVSKERQVKMGKALLSHALGGWMVAYLYMGDSDYIGLPRSGFC
jgi:hypothetical protein